MIIQRFARLLFGVFVAMLFSSRVPAQEHPAYLDSNLPIEQRIGDLLPRMTVAEKVSQISDSWGSAGIPRLKVPSMLKTEGLHSQSYSTGATLFPHPIAMAATFDPELIRRVGRETAVESKAAHIRVSWSPVLDVARDMRWGRVEETYGESPYVVSRMGVAWIEGFQGEGMIAVPKHFAGHGQPMGGRDSNDIGLSDRVMREIHLPSFRAAVEEAHAGGIMAAYGVWDGVPDNASTTLLGKILRQEWGFDGFVVSDCGALENLVKKQGIVATMPEAAALGVEAGVNMNCGPTYKGWIAKALDRGLITETELDDVVRPVLRAKMRLGLFEHPEPDKMVWEKLLAYDTSEARALAREVAVESAVLLKNDGNLLPLKKDLNAIAVIGPNADAAQTGDYSPKTAPGQMITVLQGIRSHVSPATKIFYAPGLSSPVSTDTSQFEEAVAATRHADVVVVVLGDNSLKGESTTGENRDGATLALPGAQRELLKAIYDTGKPVVLILVHGRPFALASEAEHIPAILATWYPGEEGGDATADLLFGDRNPSGRLPVTWPRSAAQLPLNYDYLPSGRRYDYYDMLFAPQWRFGYGLSYTQFRYSNLRIETKDGDPGFVTVSADVQNTGKRDGDEVSQLYLTEMTSSVVTPIVELKDFQRVSLKAGETKTAVFHLTPYQLSLLDANMVRRVESGMFRVHVGGVSPDVPNGAPDRRKQTVGFVNSLEGVSGEFTEPKAYSARFVYSLTAPQTAESGRPFQATVTVRNEGNLTDVTEARLYAGVQLGSWSFEIEPGQEKSHVFQAAIFDRGSLAVVAGSRMVSQDVSVEKAPARLELRDVHMQVGEDAVLQVKGKAQDAGGDPYRGTVPLKIDGKPASEGLSLELQPGEQLAFTLSHAFSVSGIYKVQLGDAPEQQIVVPGGIGLSLRDPLAYVKPDAKQGALNGITAQPMAIHGAASLVEGRSGRAFRFTVSGAGVDAGGLDLYRKSFTLAAWVRIEALGKGGDLALFGGRAPMGADRDNTGTRLQAGLHQGKIYMSFQGREVQGKRDVPVGVWTHLAYTYDASAQRATLYINGVADQSKAFEPYAGPLETIGDAPDFEHGAYVLDEPVVIRGALVQAQVRELFQKGMDSFREGEYISGWRPTASVPHALEAVAEIPAGCRATVTVEIGDTNGRVIGSAEVELRSGQSSYPLTRLGNGGVQARLRISLHSGRWSVSPLLRSVALRSDGSNLQWANLREWNTGANASPSVDTGLASE